MLRVRWLGRVRYRDALALQRGLFTSSPDDHLLLLEHPHVYTLGVRADMGNLLVPPADVGADQRRRPHLPRPHPVGSGLCESAEPTR